MSRYFYKLIILVIVLAHLPAITIVQDTRLRVVATTTIIADVAQNVGGDLVEVVALVPPDADAHAFQLTPNAVVAVTEADVVLANGAGLETFLGDLLEQVEITVVSNGIPVLTAADTTHEQAEDADHENDIIGIIGEDTLCEPEHLAEDDHGSCDPHVWMSVQNVMIWTDNIAAAFAVADPDNADTYLANADNYKSDLSVLDADIRQMVASIPEDQRVLVTNHDFLSYFADAYGFEIIGTVMPGTSTLSEPDPRHIADLVELITEGKLPAIFAEASTDTRLIDVVASETASAVVTTLYSGALSDADGLASTYIDYMHHNVQIIVEALIDHTG